MTTSGTGGRPREATPEWHRAFLSRLGVRQWAPAAAGRRALGFTLVEIVVAITIVAVVVAVAVPTFLGLRDEAAAREPLEVLAAFVAETRFGGEIMMMGDELGQVKEGYLADLLLVSLRP